MNSSVRILVILWVLALGETMANEITVTDDAGRQVALAQPANRIVALSPHATELVYAAGASDRLAAVAAFSDFPEQVKELPVVGSAGAIDRERLLALRPDLVVAWRSGNRTSDVQWIERLGIAVYQSEPTTLDDIALNVLDIGRLTDTLATAERAVARWRRGLRSACSTSARQTAAYLIWDAPLMTYGGAHWSNRVLSASGFDNVFGSVSRAVFSPNPEALLAARPTRVFTASGRAAIQLGGAQIPTIPVPPSLDRPTLRVLEAIKYLCGTAEAQPPYVATP